MKQQAVSQVTGRYVTLNSKPMTRQYQCHDSTKALRYAITVCLATAAVLIASTGMAAQGSNSPLKPFQAADGHKYCNPEVSKPCGSSCVILAKTCRIPWTTSISGTRPKSQAQAKVKQGYVTPRFVESAP